MLYHLLYPLSDQIAAFNVFRYITFRAAGAVVTALVLSLVSHQTLTASRSYRLPTSSRPARQSSIGRSSGMNLSTTGSPSTGSSGLIGSELRNRCNPGFFIAHSTMFRIIRQK